MKDLLGNLPTNVKLSNYLLSEKNKSPWRFIREKPDGKTFSSLSNERDYVLIFVFFSYCTSFFFIFLWPFFNEKFKYAREIFICCNVVRIDGMDTSRECTFLWFLRGNSHGLDTFIVNILPKKYSLKYFIVPKYWSFWTSQKKI